MSDVAIREVDVSAYFITNFTITDSDEYERFVAKAIPLIEAHNGRLLVADDSVVVIEGRNQDGRVVVIEFPSLAEADAWRSSDAYRAASEIRKASTDTHSMFIVDGFDPTA
ncbi:MAG: coronamic acid biosynthesis protein CmaL [Acidimicrobiia bacterium]|nr:MAG: coronamic acid biosynthesis protein CmaL [Acidimicrobiia bacterium]